MGAEVPLYVNICDPRLGTDLCRCDAGLVGKSELNPKIDGDIIFKVENKALDAILSVGRYMIMFCICIGSSCVIYSMNDRGHDCKTSPRGS